MGVGRARERGGGKKLKEKKIMKENFPNLVKEIDMQVQEAHRIPNKMDAKRYTTGHTIIKMPTVKNKEKILKAVKEKKLAMYGGASVRLSADISKEPLHDRKG